MTIPGETGSWPPHDAVSECAARYFARRRGGMWSDTDQIELDGWLAESTSHHVAWLRVQTIAARADRLAELNAQEIKASAPGIVSRPRRRRFMIPLLAAASVALIAAAGIPLANYLMQSPVRSFSTDVGGRTLLRFTDGTEFELNTDTAVRYKMTNKERIVWLDKGEAWFRVTHNPANPFAVIVGRHRIADIGTEFDVRRGADRVEVALLNGGATLSTDGVQTATLRPGDDAVATRISVSLIRKTPRELADALAWRRGMLVFRNTKLADAVREFNRYNQTKLVIADPSISDVKITAELKADHYEEFLQFAQSVLKLRVAYEGNSVLISRGDETKRTVRTHGREGAL